MNCNLLRMGICDTEESESPQISSSLGTSSEERVMEVSKETFE